MAMVKPIAESIVAFDATENAKVTFVSNGGDQIIKNKIVVRNNTTNAIVYENTVETYKLEHTIPANTLVNGTNYNYSIYTYNINNEPSPESNRVTFWCYTNPTLNFTNIESYQVIKNSYYRFEVQYYQAEGEKPNELIFILLNSFGDEISRTESIYFGEQTKISYNLNGFSDSTKYYIQAIGQTVQGTQFSTDLMPFTVSYGGSKIFNAIECTNDCENGYIKIKNNIIQINGKTDVENLIYETKDNRTQLFLKRNQTVLWDEGFKLKENTFNLGIWFTPVSYGDFCILSNEEQSLTYRLRLFRNSGSVYVALIGQKSDGTVFTTIVSNGYNLEQNIFNNLTYCTVVLTYNAETDICSIGFNVTPKTNNTLEWNTLSNVEFNKITNIKYSNISTYSYDETYTTNESSQMLFPITSIKVFNGSFDNLNMENAINYDATSAPITEWNNNTLLCCDFNNNINAGNASSSIIGIDTLTVKRRKKNTFEWITLYKKNVATPYDFNFIYYDYLCPTNESFEWAIVPSKNGIEGEYNIVKEDSQFNYCFIYDISSMFKVYGGVNYGDTSANKNIQTFETLSNKYPIVINNSEINYKKGSMSFALLDSNYMSNRRMNRKNNVDLSNKILSFLTNGLSKVIKDWNGNIILVQIIGTPSLTYNNSIGMGAINVSFDWIEQGQYDKEDDLLKNNLLVDNGNYDLNIYVEEESAIVVPKETPIAYVDGNRAVFKNTSYNIQS